MKAHLTALLFCVALPTTSYSQFSETDPCAAFGTVAKFIMTMRQDGKPMSYARKQVTETVKQAEALDFAKAIISVAYDSPIEKTEEDKVNTINEFQNALEAGCYKQMDAK